VLCCLQLAALAAAHADNLVSVDSGRLAPAPQVASDAHILVVAGVTIALTNDSLWMLESGGTAWQRAEWAAGADVLAVAGDGVAGFLLLGNAGTGTLEQVAGLSLSAGAPRLQPLPPLPLALRSAQAALKDGVLTLAGLVEGTAGQDAALQLFEINVAAAQPSWVSHASWPDRATEITSVVAQKFAVYVTLPDAAGQGDRMLRWQADAGWKELARVPGTVIAGAARAIGQAHALYLLAGGSTAHLWSFHTITQAWADLAAAEPGVTSGAAWNDGMLWTRAAADGRGIEAGFVQLRSTELLLAPLDWIVIAVYLVSMIGMGVYFYVREKRNSTADFFVGGRTIPFWAAGVSLYATNTSSISYIAIPAKSFETNWQYLTNNLIAVLGLMFVAVWIVPLLRRLDLMSVFEYLETRFHPVIRTLSSALCIAVQIASRMSVILFLPSLAIATITGIDVVWSILIMGVFTMIYTAMGGMKAVIWTDFVQLFVKMGGIVFAIGFIVFMLDGGASELLAVAAAEQKMKLFDFRWDLTQATVWGFIFLVVFDVVLTFPKDQVLMQRVLSTGSARDAGRSIWMFAAIMIPGGFLFYMVGTALYAYYKDNPERLNPLLPIDATFPLFIAAELPIGVRGLIIAGIFAAAMATLSSILNSVATLASVDFYEKRVAHPDPKVSVRFAEAMTLVAGLIGMGLALILSRYDIHSLFDVSIELAGLMGGGFAGAYTLGMFTRRANWQGVAIGVAASITLTFVAWWVDLVHPYFYLAISILLCIVVGYLASLFFPAPSPQALAGLTIYERKRASQSEPGRLMQSE
jgi:solute:Na+ symporter, SSS family